MAELSIFIDESGHFDSARAGYYVLSLVLHEQRHSIATEVAVLAEALTNLNAVRLGVLVVCGGCPAWRCGVVVAALVRVDLSAKTDLPHKSCDVSFFHDVCFP